MKLEFIDHLSTKRINVAPFRSSYIPFNIDDEFKFKYGIIDKYSSSQLISLNGQWLIKEHKSVDEINNIDEGINDTIKVPGVVQLQGYDQIQYVNIFYPFPFDPPNIPKENPAYHYRRTFIINKLEKLYLVFNGVDSCFYLFINNKKVGYSKISHSMSEFDITDFVNIGENIIDVVVVKWNVESYLEDQDKFRFTGIFRDVYLLSRPFNHISDYKINTSYKGNVGYIEFINYSNINLNLNLLNKDYIVNQNDKIMLQINDVHLWDSQDPYLYKLIISSDREKIYQNVGIKEVSIEDGIFKINHIHQKLKGVNRHEASPIRGSYITLEETYKELLIIKELNINAIRTSHYPDIFEFYELCNVLGLYVLNEADVESHGACVNKNKDNWWDNDQWQKFANNMYFSSSIYEREVSLYERDKNQTCVIIYSLGNESSFGCSFYQGLDYLKSHTTLPIHYEGVSSIKNIKDPYEKKLDMVSNMYAPPSYLRKFLKKKKENRPYILCEYSHAMGNSNGDLNDYWEVINSNDRFIGAFIWEFKDHAIFENGHYLYGGDHNELVHDNNFCVDGLVFPDGTLKSNALEVKACYSNKTLNKKKIESKNRFNKLKANNPIKVEINPDNASITHLYINNQNILKSPLKREFYRAFIDNEMWIKKDFEILINAKEQVKKIEIDKNKYTYYCQLVNNDKVIIEYTTTYSLFNDGLDISLSYENKNVVNYLPRVGFTLVLSNKYSNFIYKGFGPNESYIDKHLSSTYGTYRSNAKDNFTNNIMPQESGSHFNVTEVENDLFKVISKKPFSFNVNIYSTKQINEAKHNFELIDEDLVYYHFDVSMSGIGSNSCGPKLAKKYQSKNKNSNTFRFIFKK